MTGSLSVAINRAGMRSLEVDSDGLLVRGDFDVELTNHGGAVHVHLHLSDALSRVAAVEEDNLFVDTGETAAVRVRADPAAEPVAGELAVVTGYGDQRVEVPVTVEPGGEEPMPVDESLGERRPREREADGLARRVSDDGTVRVVALAAVAVVLAAVAVVLAPSATVALGALVVLAGVAVAGYLVLS